MIDHIWTIICSRAIIDQRSNNVTAQNILEQIKIKDNPKPDGILNIPSEIVTLWARSDMDTPAHGNSRISFLLPSSEVPYTVEHEINLVENKRCRIIGEIKSLPIREPGKHFFLVELKINDEENWREVAKIPLWIDFEPPEIEEEDSQTVVIEE